MKEPMMPLHKDTLSYGDKNRSPFVDQPKSEYPETLRGVDDKTKREKVADKTEKMIALMDAYTRGDLTQDQMETTLKNMGIEGMKAPDHDNVVQEYNARIEAIDDDEILGDALKDTAKEIAFYQFLQARGARGTDEMRDDLIQDLANNKTIKASIRSMIQAGVDETRAVDGIIENLIQDLGVSDKNVTMVAAAVRRSYNTLKNVA
ncbi:hypothetical protein KKG46_04820 [Patescibacteria group bacterium]|nr:hypothetical protein [Patescibacteria group bacterium]